MKIKIVSLNIYKGALLDAVCSFLEQEKPDIVTMQEVFSSSDPSLASYFRSFEELKKRLKFKAYDYEAALNEILPEGRIPQGNAIFSQFPISSRDAVFFNGPFLDGYVDDIRDMQNNLNMPHVLQHVVLDTPAGNVHLYNLHGTWDLDGDNFSEKRKQMSEAIINAVQDKTNVIVAGDTNARPTNQAIKNVEKHLKNIFGSELKSTFNMRRKENPGYATSVVDMIFTSPDIRVVSKSCPDIDISDHLPLVATLEIPKQDNQ